MPDNDSYGRQPYDGMLSALIQDRRNAWWQDGEPTRVSVRELVISQKDWADIADAMRNIAEIKQLLDAGQPRVDVRHALISGAAIADAVNKAHSVCERLGLNDTSVVMEKPAT